MKTILILSGGMDSSTLLYDLQTKGHEVKCLTFNYGQRHGREIELAKQICEIAHVEHQIIDLSAIKCVLKGSSQTDEVEVPHGHYAEENMKKTVVPNRNMIMLSIAMAWAVSLKFDAVAYACHGGDHAIYPDCRPEFCEAINAAFKVSDWHPVELITPYLNLNKAEILKIGMPLAVPYHYTLTCYEGKELACGKCGSCQERLEAFRMIGMTDPLAYVDDVNLKGVL